MSDLPDDVQAAIRPHADVPPEVLAALGVQLAGKREEAKNARSEIESTWLECEEAYLGIDDANRHEFAASRWQKPMTSDAPLNTSRTPVGGSHQATVYLRLTSRYVDAGTAKLGEILLPADDKAFSFSEMPVPELIAASDDESQVVHSELGAPLTRPVAPGETPPQAAAPGVPGQHAAPQRVPLTVRDLAIEKIEFARKSAKAAETRIYDWMEQTQYRAEIRKVISDAARIGVGVLKAPVPVFKRVMAITRAEDGGVNLIAKEKTVPAALWVDPWNIFPDPACGESIQDGGYVFERDYMSPRKIRELKRLPGYIASAIDQVLEEGPNKVNVTGDRRAGSKQNGRFEVWYFYGSLTKDEVRAVEQAAGTNPSQVDDGNDEAYVIVTLINDTVVRATINPLDSGAFPYHSMPWTRRAQYWAGVGVAEQMRMPQKVTNAALRSLLNNAGISAGSQFIINQSKIRPADGISWTITPNKIWLTTEEEVVDVRTAFMTVQIPNVTEQLSQIITLGERFAEETTSIPLIAQGQSGATTPDTFGAAQLQNNNANQLLRSIGYAFDDYITEPVVRQYYEYLLVDPDVPNEEKAEFQIDAHGSIALVERAIQDQSIAQMGNMAANPIYGIDPKKWATLFLKSKRLSPDQVQYTKEEQAKLDASPPPEAPAVTVAKIAADTEMKKLAASQAAEQRTDQNEAQIAAAAHTLEVGQAQTEQQRVHGELTMKAHQIDLEHQRALLDYANRMKVSLDQAKASLAKTAMQLQTERELNAANRAVDLHKHRNPKPPVQVPGRAANGKAFSQAPR